MAKKKTTEQFIKEAKEKHGDKYDYSKTEYISAFTKVCIICPEHGEFWQRAKNHVINGDGCPKCGKIKNINAIKKSTEHFIDEAKRLYGDKYDYSKVNYINCKTKVEIICCKHGISFWQTPANHLWFGDTPCPKCKSEDISSRSKYDTSWFIKKAKEIHGDKYDYSKVEYDGYHNRVCIICPEHGEFWQLVGDHIHNKSGCPKCMAKESSERNKLPFEHFLKKAKEVHGDKYQYDESTYVDTRTKFRIICPEHGEFWQFPTNHYRGVGCPICKAPKCETKIRLFLKENTNEEFVYQYYSSWLKGQSLDFFFPKYNFGIEYDGEQHFMPVNFTGHMSKEQMNENLKKAQERDKRKDKKCAANGVKLFRIKYDEDIEESLTKILNLYNIEILGDK